MPKRSDPRPYRRNTAEKFWMFVDKSNGPNACWPWRRPLKPNGYGQFKLEGLNWGSHRLAWVLTNGEVPDGLVIDHLCRNRGCCNPAHMEPVTNAENVLRGIGVTAQNAAMTHCAQGHPLTGDNMRRVGAKKQRSCVTCVRARARAAKAARKVAIAADPSLAKHGLILTYSNWGCRCAPCKEAWSAYMREYHAKRCLERTAPTRQLRAA